jgi:hypothetical protein
LGLTGLNFNPKIKIRLPQIKIFLFDQFGPWNGFDNMAFSNLTFISLSARSELLNRFYRFFEGQSLYLVLEITKSVTTVLSVALMVMRG